MLFTGLMATVMMATCVACGSEESDNPIEQPKEIEPLTEYLRPTLTDGKKWLRERGSYNSSAGVYDTETHTECVERDTIVDGYTAKKVLVYMSDGTLLGYNIKREENGRVYTLQPHYDLPDDKIWGLDFNTDAQDCETIHTALNHLVTISRGTITLMGKMRRAVKVWCRIDRDHQSPYEYWVEGIGPLFGHSPIYNSILPSTPLPKTCARLLECYDGEEKIYDYREFSDDLYEEIEVFTDIDQLQ